jgi:methionyl-tRNA formyltransferase
MNYSEYIVMGTGILKFKIALLLKSKDIPATVWEYNLASSVKESCALNGIGYQFLRREEIYGRLKQLRPGALIISAINTYLFPADIVGAHTIINYHNSLLPWHPGMNAEAWQIYEMDDYAGVTWHYVDVNIDAGAIISQEKIPLDNGITSLKLLKRQSTLAYSCFAGFVNDLLSGGLRATGQENHHNRRWHYIKDVPNNGLLDLTWTAPRASAFLRAMDYGAINTLGLPAVMVDDKTYSCKSYQITESSQNAETCLQDNRLYIENNGLKIIVSLLDSQRNIS